MEYIIKKGSNPLGRYNRLVPSTDKVKFWHMSLEDDHTPDSQCRTVWTCCDGWLLISQEKQGNGGVWSYHFSIWKPESSEPIINLPPLNLKSPEQFIGAGTLVSAPGNPGSMVLLFEEYLRYVIYYRLGDKQWTERWFGKEIAAIGHADAKDSIPQRSITLCEGKLYAATFCRRSLMTIEEDMSKHLKVRPLNCRLPSSFAPTTRRGHYLLDFRGQLCCVELIRGGVNHEHIIDVEVSKLELSGNQTKWLRVKSAEDRAFFISDNYNFSCPVNEPEIRGGHIYLFENKRFYSINIKDKSLSASLPLQNLSKLNNSPFFAIGDLIRLCNPQAKTENPVTKLEAEKKGMVFEDHNEARSNNLCDLPLDTLGFISKKLYLVDHINFRSVCRNFRLAAPCIKWSKTSFNSQFPSLSPWLVFNSCATQNFIDSQFGSRYLIKIPECLLDGQVRYSKGGWLLICSSNFMYFYHPLKKENRKLPQGVGQPLLYNRCFGYGLSSSPNSEDSILVGNNDDTIYYTCRRQGEWVEWNEYRIRDYYLLNHNSSIYFDGAFYFLNGDGKVGVFELNDGRVSWKVLEELETPCKNYCYNYLLECGGNLLSVFVVGQLVHIYKLSFNAPMTWEKVTSLGNYALFVSSSSSFSVIPNSSDMENKIYFCRLYGMDIVYYCLSTNKFFTCGKMEVVPDIDNTTEFFFSTWIEPRWQL